MDLDPAAVVQRFGLAWGEHDLDATLALCTPGCAFESTGPPPDGARHVGQAELRAAWAPIFADTAATFTVEETLSAEDRVVQRWRYDWDGGHVRGVDVFRVTDGLVSEKYSYVKG